MDVRDYIQQHAGGFFDDLKQWLAIPSISADPGQPPRRARPARTGSPPTCGPPGSPRWRSGRPAPPDRRACPRSSPAGPPPTPPRRRSASTGTTTCSRSSRSASGTRRRSSRPSGTACCSAAAPPTTRARCCCTRSACAPAWRRPARPRPPVTLKLLIEGEEESGSPHFAELLRARADRLACDVIVVSDTTMWAADVPSMCTGMRGLVDAEITPPGPGPRPALRLLRRRGAEPAACDGRAARGPARRRRPGHRCPGSTTRWCRSRRRSGSCSRGCRSRRRRGSPTPGTARPPRRGRVHHPGAGLGPADGRGQRHVGRPHRPGRQDDRAARGAREALVPAGRRPGAGRRLAGLREYVAAHTPAGHRGGRSRLEGPGCGRASRRSTRRRCRRASGRWSARSAARCCSPGRAAAGPRPTWPTSWPRRWCSSRSAWTPTASTRRTRRSRWRCCSRAPRRRPTCGTSWRTAGH